MTAMPNSRPVRSTSVEHLLTAFGIEPVRRLVEQQQLGIVHERLRELDALLHAGRVAADESISLLVQSDVPQHLGGALARGGERQSGDLPHVRDEVGAADVERQAVVLGHVADELPHLERVCLRRRIRARTRCRSSAAAGRGGCE